MWKRILLGAVLAAAAVTLVAAQPRGQGFGMGQGPGFGGPMPFVMGRVVSAEIAKGTITAEIFGQQMVLYPVRATVLTKRVEVKPSELAVGDTLEVSGLPLRLEARTVRVQAPVAQGTQPAELAGPAGGDGPAFGRRGRMPAMAMATGKVTATNPLTVAVEIMSPSGEATEVAVEIKVTDTTRITKPAPADWAEVVEGVTFQASGQMNEQGQYILDTLTLGEELPTGFGMRG